MLDLVVSFTASDEAHLYWLDPATRELRLINASPGLEDGRIPRASLQFSPILVPGILRRPAILASTGFRRQPCRRCRLCSLSPFASEEKLAGILTLSRKEPRMYGAVEIEAAARAGEALTAAMRDLEREREVGALRAKLRLARQENLLLEKRLAERKLVERAKGLLQVHFGWTEEDAYYHLRRTSRQQRTPMATIAQQVIDVVAAKEMEEQAERMSA